jgi:hypothetical protein
LSKGRLALAGSSFLVESAFITEKPPMPRGAMAASDPPASMASVSPTRIDFHASPMAWAEVEQAETGDQLGPLAPYLMLIRPGAMLMIIWRMKKGDSRSNPFSRPLRCCSSSEVSPPIPLPTITPTRSGS